MWRYTKRSVSHFELRQRISKKEVKYLSVNPVTNCAITDILDKLVTSQLVSVLTI